RQAIDSGAPPSLARIPMTPEEVAASYAEAEGSDADDSMVGSAAMDDTPGASKRAGCGRDDASQDG
ncbi:MAG TPA: hypothetical protein VF070_14920, partial [Streptosporangiaceae bacterium]